MEEVCQRFPLIAQKILNHVDIETLINFKEAGRTNAAFLEEERFYWIRKIHRYNGLFGEFQEVWKKIVRRTPVEVIKEVAIAVHQFPKKLHRKFHRNDTECAAPRCVCNGTLLSPLDFAQKIEKEWHPLFIVVSSGSTNLCNHIIQKASVLQDPTCFDKKSGLGKITPIVYAADFMESMNVFELLHEKAEDKNPILFNKTNWTLLHTHCFVSSNSFHGQITQKADPENKKCSH